MNNSIMITGDEYKTMVAVQKGFCSKDGGRPVLQGMNFKSVDGIGTITALDGYKMHIMKPEQMQDLDNFNVIAILPVLRVTKKQNVFITFDSDTLKIDCCDSKTVVRYIDGEYINTDRITPNEENKPYYQITFGVKLLHEALTAYKATGAERVCFKFNESNCNAVVVVTSDTNEKGILMPVRTI